MDYKPKWQLPVNGSYISSRVKYHCFVDSESLCKKYTQDTNYYETDIESGEIAMRPEIACKVCRSKWMKEFDI